MNKKKSSDLPVQNTSAAKVTSDWQIYKRLLTYVWPLRFAFFLSIIGFVFYASMDVLAADIMQFLIDTMGGTVSVTEKSGVITTLLDRFYTLEANNTEQARVLIPVLIIIIAIIRAIGSFMGNYFIKYVGSKIVHQLRCELFEHMVKLPLGYIYSKSTGELLSRITFNVSQVTGAVTNALTILFREGLTALFIFGYLIYINWQLTFTFIVVAPFIAFIVRGVSKRFRKISRRLQNSMGDVTHVISEAVNGSKDMRIYGGQETETKRFTKASAYTLKQQLKMAKTDAAFSPTIQVLLTVAVSFLVWLGLSSEVVNSMSPGLFVSFLVAAGVIGKPLRQLTSIVNIIQKALAASQDIFDQLDELSELELGDKTIENVKGNLRFDRVTFTYPGQKEPTLKNISFEAKAGEMVALVGASGGGKTTLAGLIPRFYNIEEGTITIDDVPVASLTLNSLRAQIALVSQNVVLLNDTVYNNIAFGEMQSFAEEKVIAAATQANADSFIQKLEEKYSTTVGDNGVLLSGGQRQRIAIARAILKDAPILILDEATSALDNESERLIQKALIDVVEDRTTIVIAHRLSTIERADKILVIDAGEIVEQGTHADLLALNGRYAELHRSSLEKQPEESLEK